MSASTGMLSDSAGFPLMICLMAMLIPPIVGVVTSIERFVRVPSMLDGFSGSGLFRSFSKCSAYLFRCAWASVIGLPYLFLTVHSGLLYFSAGFFGVSYSFLLFPESNISFEAGLSCSAWIQSVLLIPSFPIFLISATTWMVLPVSHIMWIFYVHMLTVALIFGKSIGFVTSE